jgi:uncharacterized protein
MRKNEAIAILRDQRQAITARGVTALYLFGSTAEGRARPDSDLDVFLDIDPRSFSLLDLVAIQRILEERSGTNVDITTRDALHPAMRRDIELSALRVF